MRAASLGVGNPAGLTPLDLATANMLGQESRQPLPRAGSDVSLEETLFDVIEPALSSGRCLVSFSGGRESAFVLGAATAAARSRGYDDPIPVTLRYPLASADRDRAHQERVIAFLGLREWERVTIHDEFELVGPYAVRALEQVGVLFPVTAYVLLPLLDLARGGWLLAGGGLTDFFAYWRWRRVADVLARRRPLRRRDLRQLSLAALPSPARERVLLARYRHQPAPWLRADAAHAVERLLAAEAAAVPMRFDAALSRQRQQRCYSGMRASLDAVAASAGARFLMPLRTDEYASAVAAKGRRLGFGDRLMTLRRLAGDLLPDELLVRSDVVNEQRVLFGERARSFAASWSGGGLDPDVVDCDVLRECWARAEPPWAATMLFQMAFAHDEGVEGRKKVCDALTSAAGTREFEARASI
jgi:hypothetical protein